MPNRTDVLNHLIERYQLKRYLELGTQVPELNFDKINCPYKVGVDPDPNAKATFCKTSDEYFANLDFVDNEMGTRIYRGFDIIFIDGLHTAEQVKKDFENSLKILSQNGFIVLHDCNPEKEEHTIVPRPTPRGHYNGDVYKFAIELGEYFKKFYTVDVDNGCGVWNNAGTDIVKDWHNQPHNWASFSMMRKELLNLISFDEFVKL